MMELKHIQNATINLEGVSGSSGQLTIFVTKTGFQFSNLSRDSYTGEIPHDVVDVLAVLSKAIRKREITNER
jgi:hypothetical protein